MVPILNHVRWLRHQRVLAERIELAELSKPLRTLRQLKRLSAFARKENEEFEFAVLGDAEPGRFWFSRALFNIPGVFERQIRAIQEHPIDFSVQLGDMVSRGIASHYRLFFQNLLRLGPNKPYLTVIGNHDRHTPNLRSDAHFYRSCFGKTNYSYDHGNVRFVVLDTSTRSLSSHQLRWLDMTLKTEKRKIIFTHIPPAVLSWTDFAGARGIGGFRPRAQEFVELASKHHVERVYMGHIHGFGVQDFRGVRYVLSGGGGSPLFPSSVQDRFYHYIVVRVTPHALNETVYSLDGHHFKIPSGKVVISA